jgi:hypothetical protein
VDARLFPFGLFQQNEGNYLMSTKGLQQHKKVAEVTLNAAGKAATLTLAPGWHYEGSRGPFTLTNVEHGHQIVKAATSDGTGPAVLRAPKVAPPTPRGQGVAPDPIPDRRPADNPGEAPARMRGHEMFVYRVLFVSEANQHEVGGWLRFSSAPDKAAIDKTLKGWGHNGFRDPVDSYVGSLTRWTKKDERKARDDRTAGCPWGGDLMLSTGSE